MIFHYINNEKLQMLLFLSELHDLTHYSSGMFIFLYFNIKNFWLTLVINAFWTVNFLKCLVYNLIVQI
jgi:hypothetical protein